MKKIFYLLFFTCLSCSNDDNSKQVNDFKGYYKVISISSETLIDLNNDGVKSLDYLQEVMSDFTKHNGEIVNFGYDPDTRRNYTTVRPLPYHSPSSVKFIEFNFPFQKMDSLYIGNDTFIDILMHYRNEFSFIGYDINNKGEVTLDNSDIEYTFGFSNTAFVSFQRISKTQFELVFDKEVYDFSEGNWVSTRLSSIYEKVEEVE